MKLASVESVKLLVFVLLSFFIISNIMVRTTVLYLIAEVERIEYKLFYLKHKITLCQELPSIIHVSFQSDEICHPLCEENVNIIQF